MDRLDDCPTQAITGRGGPRRCIRGSASGSLTGDEEDVTVTQHNIDPSRGPDAAADLPDEELGMLLQILVWELAVRVSREQFEDQVRRMAIFRAESEQDLATARRLRDQRRFVDEVMEDIRRLPETRSRSSEPSTGLYL